MLNLKKKPLNQTQQNKKMKERTITLEALAKLTNATLVGNPEYLITHVADLETAEASDVSFLSNSRYEKSMKSSLAGAFFVHASYPAEEEKNYLLVEDPSLAFQKAINFFFEDKDKLSGFTGIHPSATIHTTAKIGENVTIGPFVVVDQESNIGDGTTLLAHASIGPFTTIGTNCLIHTHVSIRERCLIGNNVIIQPGAIIGSCGFGYITDKRGRHIKLEQVGTVTIEDDVEIGANTTIDRSRFKTTRIGRGTKIDNLVQIGHGASIGEDNIFVSQSGMAGSSKTGRHVVLGGQAGITGHITIGNNVMIAAKSGISKSLNKAGNYGGHPAIPFEEHNRKSVYLKNIERYVHKIKALEEKVTSLEKKSEQG